MGRLKDTLTLFTTSALSSYVLLPTIVGRISGKDPSHIYNTSEHLLSTLSTSVLVAAAYDAIKHSDLGMRIADEREVQRSTGNRASRRFRNRIGAGEHHRARSEQFLECFLDWADGMTPEQMAVIRPTEEQFGVVRGLAHAERMYGHCGFMLGTEPLLETTAIAESQQEEFLQVCRASRQLISAPPLTAASRKAFRDLCTILRDPRQGTMPPDCRLYWNPEQSVPARAIVTEQKRHILSFLFSAVEPAQLTQHTAQRINGIVPRIYSEGRRLVFDFPNLEQRGGRYNVLAEYLYVGVAGTCEGKPYVHVCNPLHHIKHEEMPPGFGPHMLYNAT